MRSRPESLLNPRVELPRPCHEPAGRVTVTTFGGGEGSRPQATTTAANATRPRTRALRDRLTSEATPQTAQKNQVGSASLAAVLSCRAPRGGPLLRPAETLASIVSPQAIEDVSRGHPLLRIR